MSQEALAQPDASTTGASQAELESRAPSSEQRTPTKKYQVMVGISALLFMAYLALFLDSVLPYWFSSEWTTDDSYQQLFPFLSVLHPNRWEGDIVYDMMRGYLTPLHYCITYLFTVLTGSPIMAGHWVMLLQLGGTLLFLFLAVRASAGIIPAFFSLVWMLHSRGVVQRLTCGLPRGWSAPIATAFLWAVLTKRHKTVLVVLLLGCLLHPPTTLILAMTYGTNLIIGSIKKSTRAEYLPKLRGYILLSPIYIVTTLLSIKMPTEFGSMASLEVAQSMPEFASPGGRFPFVPLLPYWIEFYRFGFEAFLSKWHNPGKAVQIIIAVSAVLSVLFLALSRKPVPRIPREILLFGLFSVVVHQLSRIFAFHLYVPNRHLQLPLAIFFIAACTIGFWRWFSDPSGRFNFAKTDGVPGINYVRGFCGLLILSLVVFIGSGVGLSGKANFNTNQHQKGTFPQWIRDHTPADALVAGHPTLVDAVPLFGERRVYISTEMAHPFYLGYYAAIRPRIDISLKAHYAPTLADLYDLVAPEGIDYFVFNRSEFYPEALNKASYFRPFDQLVYQLTRVPDPLRFAYRELPREVDIEKAPYMPFKDAVAAVVDIHLLGKALGKE